MGCLKLYAPEDANVTLDAVPVEDRTTSEDHDSDAIILSWRNVPRTFSHGSLMELIARSRVLYHNRTCSCCGRPTVEPVQLDDALIGKNRNPIPGSATLVGFHCQTCHHEWNA